MTAPKLRAFHNDPKIQAKYLNRIDRHYDLDEIVQGRYWQDGKGCAVGCVTHDPDGNHQAYEAELGIPVALAYLEDRIFEALPRGSAKEWPRSFMQVIPLGADLSNVTPLFLAWLMDDPTYGLAFTTPDATVRSLSLEIARRYRTGEGLSGPAAEELSEKLRAAMAARDAWAARDARAARAAWAAWDARDAWAAWPARAAMAARDAWDARAAWDARDAWAAWAAFVEASAAELLRLMAEAPVPL